jgi:antitoxin (DNA-binding transcriptional repressor) of toxin-antitoxin stability system
MTVITPESAETEAEAEELLTSVMVSVRALRTELDDLRRRVRSGEFVNTTGDSKTITSAVSLLETCQKVENRLAEYRKTAAGIARGNYALDLDQARVGIGRALDRLRLCADAGELSE